MASEIAVVGAGGWGTALAKVLGDKGEAVTLWCHGDDSFRQVSEARENRTYLPGIKLPPTIRATQSLAAAVEKKNLVLCALPSHVVRPVLYQVGSTLEPEATLVCATKGLEEESLRTMAELFIDMFGAGRKER